MDANALPLQQRWLWLAASVATALLFASLQWLLRQPGERLSPWVERGRQWPGAPWLWQMARLSYAVGIPALALFWQGALTERGLGLQPVLWISDSLSPALIQANWVDWVRDVGWAAGIGGGGWLLVIVGQHLVQRATGEGARYLHQPGRALREAVYHQVHWAFYREPFVLLWGVSWGAWAGLGLVALEAALNPVRWEDWRFFGRGRDLLVRAVLAVVSLLLYLQTQNLWLAILTDWALGWALGSARPTEG